MHPGIPTGAQVEKGFAFPSSEKNNEIIAGISARRKNLASRLS
jgi:hypothetical protein